MENMKIILYEIIYGLQPREQPTRVPKQTKQDTNPVEPRSGNPDFKLTFGAFKRNRRLSKYPLYPLQGTEVRRIPPSSTLGVVETKKGGNKEKRK